jgi:hypothetical protein
MSGSSGMGYGTSQLSNSNCDREYLAKLQVMVNCDTLFYAHKSPIPLPSTSTSNIWDKEMYEGSYLRLYVF